LMLIFSIAAISLITMPRTGIINIFCVNPEWHPLYCRAWSPINRHPHVFHK
jgi:uncharacterized Zn-finger protein